MKPMKHTIISGLATLCITVGYIMRSIGSYEPDSIRFATGGLLIAVGFAIISFLILTNIHKK